jgi:4a-hydroxytetrahydrobiopterin dehydratase
MAEDKAELHDDWRVEGDALVRDFVLTDFAAALAFVNRVGEAAEAAGHHPDIHLHGYKRVRLTLSTHSEGRVTEQDHALAAQIDPLVP